MTGLLQVMFPTHELDCNPRRRSKKVRYCIDCGQKVCSYKNPRSQTTRCYSCEDKQPWTSEWILEGW